MRKKERFGKYKNPVSVIYCYATSYPKSQWLITSTILFVHDSADVQFEVALRETAPLLLPWCWPRSAGGSKVPHCHVWEWCRLQAAGCRASMLLLQECFLLWHGPWTSFFTWWFRNWLLRSVIASLLPRSVTRGQPTLQGKRDPPSWWLDRHMHMGLGRTTEKTASADNTPWTPLLETITK